MMDLMEQFRKERRMTVVMVSHDINLAALYADTMLLLKEGKTSPSDRRLKFSRILPLKPPMTVMWLST